MPNYTYICDSCQNKFELFFYIKDYNDKPKCINCKSKSTRRSYEDDLSNIFGSVKKSDNELKTIGDLANRNRDRMSNDQKTELHTKHNAYKDQGKDKPLPTGMSRIPKTEKIKWTQS